MPTCDPATTIEMDKKLEKAMLEVCEMAVSFVLLARSTDHLYHLEMPAPNTVYNAEEHMMYAKGGEKVQYRGDGSGSTIACTVAGRRVMCDRGAGKWVVIDKLTRPMLSWNDKSLLQVEETQFKNDKDTQRRLLPPNPLTVSLPCSFCHLLMATSFQRPSHCQFSLEGASVHGSTNFVPQRSIPSAAKGISPIYLTPDAMIQNKMLIEIPLIHSCFPTTRMCARHFQVPIYLWMLLFKVIEQQFIVAAECCQAHIALYVGRMIPSEVLEQPFSIHKYLPAIRSVANYLRHVGASRVVINGPLRAQE